MRALICFLSLYVTAPGIGLCQSPAHGDLIGGPPAAQPTPATVSLTQTNEKAGAAGSASVSDGAFFTFDRLAGYPLKLSDELLQNTNRQAWANEQVNGMIPAPIKAADGKKITVEGFMMPVTFNDKGKVTSFLLTINQPSCCFSGASLIHEFVVVRVSGPGVEAFMEGPVRVQGTFHVGAEREEGILSSIYRLDEDTASPPKPHY